MSIFDDDLQNGKCHQLHALWPMAIAWQFSRCVCDSFWFCMFGVFFVFPITLLGVIIELPVVKSNAQER